MAVAALRCGEDQQGGPMVAHGGWTAAVFDDVLGRIPAIHGDNAVTASLEVNFLKPVPVDRDLSLRARIEEREGRRLRIVGALYLAGGDTALAEASGVWVIRRPDHFDRHRRWLAEQESRAEGGAGGTARTAATTE